MYYLHYDAGTGIIVAPYHSAVHGKEIPIYNTEPITMQDEDGNDVTQAIGTIQTGTTLDLSAIPTPYVEITDSEHDDWMQNQSTRKIDIETLKLVEYTPPEQPPQIVTPSVSQDLADVWEAIFAIVAEKGGM